MSIISVTNINDGDAVTAASINNQVNTIVNDYNGNITAANLAANAITDGKITANNLLATKFSNPYKFSVYRSTALTLSSGGPVTFDTKVFDTSSNVDIVTNKGRFTAPVAGFYQLNSAIMASVGSGSHYFAAFYKNGTEYHRFYEYTAGATTNWTFAGGALISLSANDYIEVWFSPPSLTTVFSGATSFSWFTGFLASSI